MYCNSLCPHVTASWPSTGKCLGDMVIYLILGPALQCGNQMTKGQKGKSVMDPGVQKPVLTFLIF